MDRDRQAREAAIRAALARMTARHASARAAHERAGMSLPAAKAVPEPIAESWQRSLSAGLDPGSLDVPYADIPAYTPDLVRIGSPVLDRLADSLDGTGVAVILGDADGTVLHRWTSERGLLSRLDHVNLAPGFDYAEGVVGTNAIGTALAQRAPSFVSGVEHFADDLTGLACAAVPLVQRSTGRIVGFLDATSPAGKGHPLMLALVRQAAGEVERALEDAGFRWSGMNGDGRTPAMSISLPEPNIAGSGVLTPTEQSVADLVVLGMTNHAVARRLSISPHTVDTHLRHIYAKLDVRSRVELARVLLAGATSAGARNIA